MALGSKVVRIVEGYCRLVVEEARVFVFLVLVL